MQIIFCFDGVEKSQALKEYTEEKLSFLDKFLVGTPIHVNFSSINDEKHVAVKYGKQCIAASSEDFYKSVDALKDKLFVAVSKKNKKNKESR